VASFVISLAALRRNTALLRETADAAGCKVVLAMKGFACWKAFPHFRDHLDGCCASGLWEAMLARDYFGKQVVTYSPAYQEEEIRQLCGFTHHLDFNSLSQWFRFRGIVTAHPRFQSGQLHCGLRVNPECSTGSTPLYDPCVPGSRLGITADQLAGADLTGLSGLHFHTLCEQNSDDLEKTLAAVDEKFGHLLRSPRFTYLNMGGGHWITKPFYDRERLIRLVRETRAKYGVEVWLEPGEANAIHSGVLRATVLDVFESMGHRHAILDISATAHMPDVLEMPYRPDVFLVESGDAGSSRPGNALASLLAADGVEIWREGERLATLPPPENPPAACPCVTLEGETYLPASDPTSANQQSTIDNQRSSIPYRLGGPTCLAGDVVGDFAFPRPLEVGDILVFDDMAHYTMVKTTTFNGVPHPSIVLQHDDGRLETIREFGYADFRDRLS
jgi:carboxynorspermidine decarboxylase